MRKIGLIGGMSWLSTRSYYEHINRQVQTRAGDHVSAPMVIESLDFSEIYRLQSAEDWARAAGVLGAAAKRLEAAGAEMIIIGANSMHKVYREVSEQVSVPILHIAECVGEAMAAAGVKKAALVSGRNVMMESFYRRRLVAHGVDLLPPDMGGVELLEKIIYDELMRGKVTREAERALRSMFTEMGRDGAEAVILANTELGQVVDIDANVLPIFDSTRIHAERAAKWIMGEG